MGSVLLITLLLALGFLQIANATIRTAQLKKGSLETRRDLADGSAGRRHRRYLAQESDPDRLLLMGIDSTDEDAAFQALARLGGSLLQPLPPDHWLIHIKSSAVQELLSMVPAATLGDMPAKFKMSQHMDDLLDTADAWVQVHPTNSQDAASTTSGTPIDLLSTARDEQTDADAALVATDDVPPELDGFLVTRTQGGEFKLHLSVLGLPQHSGTQEEKASSISLQVNELQQGLQAFLAAAAPVTARGRSMQDALGECSVQIAPIGVTGYLEVPVCLRHVRLATEWLADQPKVTWVTLLPQAVTFNLFANAITQTGSLPDPLTDIRLNASLYPFWQEGLDGEGHIVGVVDDGLDPASCYFRGDRAIKLDISADEVVSDPITGRPVYVDEEQRKLTHYLSYADFEPGRHGTHTAGTILGACVGDDPIDSPDYATGMVPNAKLFFFDAGFSGNTSATLSTRGAQRLTLPPDPTRLLTSMYMAGVKVISNSWGFSRMGFAEEVCGPMDGYIRLYDDLTVLFAAGNTGYKQDAVYGTGSVTAPSSCKNVISVGATATFVDRNPLLENTLPLRTGPNSLQLDFALEDFRASSAEYGLIAVARSSNGTQLYTTALIPTSNAFPWLGPPASVKTLGWGRVFEVVLAYPDPYACESLEGDYVGRIVIFLRGNCTFAVKGPKIDLSGAAVGIMLDLTPNALAFTPNAPQLTLLTVPLLLVSLDQAQKLYTYVSDPDTQLSMMLDEWEGSPYENVDWYSAFGTLPHPDANIRAQQDLRIKPDLVAPGTLRSAAEVPTEEKGFEDCNTEIDMGTSMATPVVAGSAVLVRQYFENGFYPSGAANPGSSYLPSTALIRGVLTAGAIGLTGMATQVGMQLGPPPDVFQGFGRVDVGRSLPLQSYGNGWTMQVLDRVPIPVNNITHSYYIDVPGTGPLSICLTWIDWPGFPASNRALVNDLDLKVQYVSDMDPDLIFDLRNQWWGNMGTSRDVYNNVERVYLERPLPGSYKITVTASYLFYLSRPQQYSLVALGAFEGVFEGPYNPSNRPPAPAPPPDAPDLPVEPPQPFSPEFPPPAAPEPPAWPEVQEDEPPPTPPDSPTQSQWPDAPPDYSPPPPVRARVPKPGPPLLQWPISPPPRQVPMRQYPSPAPPPDAPEPPFEPLQAYTHYTDPLDGYESDEQSPSP